MISSTIRAFQATLPNFRFQQPESFSEGFAQARFLKKMEVPDESRRLARKQRAWDEWVNHDAQLELPSLLPGNWYKARLMCHKALRHFRLGELSFSNGDEFHSNFGKGSIESKLLRSEWSCTPDAFDLWASTAYEFNALKVAVRKRFRRHVAKRTKLRGKPLDAWMRHFHRESFRLFGGTGTENIGFLCFKRVLRFVTLVENGNRFSTVRKNNEKDRPICIENICNMLVQRRIGLGLRNCLNRHFGIDLENLAAVHVRLIEQAFTKIATIDLKNASDSVMLNLCRFCLPPVVFKFLDDSRAFATLGPDGAYHVTKKMSSMGNGFTFELMTLLLTCLCKQHDPQASVFGDDIIVDWSKSYAVIRDLTAVGFAVNEEKSFIHGDFRESCGGNYHWLEGYVESYDFEYPETVHDCCMVYAKAKRLSHKYPSFKKLEVVLRRSIPLALRGIGDTLADTAPGLDHAGLPAYFAVPGAVIKHHKGQRVSRRLSERVKDAIRDYQLKGPVIYFKGFKWVPELASPTVVRLSTKHHWAKYMMYLHSGGRVDDEIRDRGSWVMIDMVSLGGRSFRLSALPKRPRKRGS